MVEDIHARSRIIEAKATHRIFNKRFNLPQAKAIGQVRVRTKKRTRRCSINRTRSHECRPLKEELRIIFGEDFFFALRGGKAHCDPKIPHFFNGCARHGGNVFNRERLRATQKRRCVGMHGRKIASVSYVVLHIFLHRCGLTHIILVKKTSSCTRKC